MRFNRIRALSIILITVTSLFLLILLLIRFDSVQVLDSEPVQASGQAVVPASADSSFQRPNALLPSVDERPVSSQLVVGNALWHRLSTSQNLRAFAVYARQRPSEGGVSYANEAVKYCNQVRTHLKDFNIKNGQRDTQGEQDSIVYARRQKAAQTMYSRCADFTDDELFGRDALALEDELAAKGDAVHLASRAVLDAKRSGDAGRLSSSLQAALHRHDPLVLEAIFPVLLLQKRGSEDRASLYFDGQILTGREAVDVVQAARLLPCLYGKPCGEDHFDVAANCAGKVDCHSGVLEMERTSLRAMDPARADRLDRTLARFKEIVDAADWKALTPAGR